jgi:aspartate racemase
MKTIGMIGGTGWISTVEYYRIINEETNRRLGGLEFARCILYSLNYGDIDRLNRLGAIEKIYSLVTEAAHKLESAGADCIILCANTLHQFADALGKEIQVPIVHIADATAREILKAGLKKTGLIGTKQTMEMDFYRSKLEAAGIGVIVPETDDRNFIQETISGELLKGIFREESRERFRQIIRKLHTSGAEGIILGCTEIPLLIQQQDAEIPLFNTLNIHALAAVEAAL